MSITRRVIFLLLIGLLPLSVLAENAPTRHTLVILPLDSLTGYTSHDWMRTSFVEVVAGKLTGNQDLMVLDGLLVAKALRGTSDTVPAHATLELGLATARHLDADLVLWGTLDKELEQLTIDLHLTETTSGEPVVERRLEGSFEDPWPLLNDMAGTVVEALRLTPSEEQSARIDAQAARDRYTLTLYGRALNAFYGVGEPVNLENADANLERALRIDPWNALIYHTLGQLKMVQGKPGEANRAFYEALKYWPDYPDVHRQMARLSEDKQQLDEAVSHLGTVLAAEPGDKQAIFDISRILAGQQKVKQARETLRPVVEKDSGSDLMLEALRLYARLCVLDQDPDEALTSYQRLLTLDPLSIDAVLGLGACHLARWELDDAETNFRFLARLEPNNPLSAHFLGEIALLRGDTAGAVKAFRDEGMLRSGDGSAWAYLAETYRRAKITGREIDAERTFQTSEPSNPVPLNNQAIGKFRNKNWEEAITLLRQAIERTPGWALLYENLGLVLADYGDALEALEAFRMAIHLKPTRATAHYHLGLLLVGEEHLERAQASFEAATAADPRLAPAQYNLGVIRTRLGDTAGAIDAFVKYLEVDPEVADAQRVREQIARLEAGHTAPQ